MENPAVNPSVSAINAAPEKWRALLNQFEEVLNLNIFIIVFYPITDPSILSIFLPLSILYAVIPFLNITKTKL